LNRFLGDAPGMGKGTLGDECSLDIIKLLKMKGLFKIYLTGYNVRFLFNLDDFS